MSSEKTVAVVGGGLVGALNACFLAQRGFQVDLYEKRADIRTEDIVRGRSLNLALSHRGRMALQHVGLEEEVVRNCIPMGARMIHDLNGKTRPIPYGKQGQNIMSVDRRRLNEVLLTGAEAKENVTLHFQHKLVSCDFHTGDVVFQQADGKRVERRVDLIVGNDGAFSGVRREMMRQAGCFDYSQEYIPHGYMELCINPSVSGEFAMATNFLHIWPRNEFMMIALPNQDKTFTTTLFMPFDMFDSIKTEYELMQFFRKTFPDAIPLLGEEALTRTYLSSKGLPMVSIKCSPYHFGDKAVIMGDAAHAMVPFYGQGMNAGFEDCLVFDDILDKHGNNFARALPAYTADRKKDAQAINDLAMKNYVEMRKSVNSRLFLLRKKLDNLLYALFPRTWVPLYTMVSFTRTRYHECIKKREWQDKVLSQICWYGALVGVAASCLAGYSLLGGNEQMSLWERISSTFQRVSLWTTMRGIGYYLHLTSD